MPTPQEKAGAYRWLAWIAAAISGLVGMYYGFEFGSRLNGLWFGVLLAVNGALFCSILVAAAVEKLIGGRLGSSGSKPGE